MGRASLVVSHGGTGTTVAALAAGVPQVVVPLFALDQFETALRVSEVGVGASVPSRPDFLETAPSMTAATPGLLEELRASVNAVLEDQAPRRRAASIAAELAALPDCAACLDDLELSAFRDPDGAT